MMAQWPKIVFQSAAWGPTGVYRRLVWLVELRIASWGFIIVICQPGRQGNS
jgi:hypothetical protein